MNKKVIIMLPLLYGGIIFSQEKDSSTDPKEIIKEFSEKACLCVDSISLFNKEKKEILADVSSCIDEQASAVQLAKLLVSAKDLEKSAPTVNGKKNITLNFDSNKKSKQYIDSYNDIERYLMNNCNSLKKAANVSETMASKFTSDDNAIELFQKGNEHSKTKEWKEAIKFYELALKLDRTFVYAWDNLGIAYRMIDDYDNAINAYKSSLLIDPKGKMPLQNLAVAYIHKKDFKSAVEAYENLDKAYPGDAEVYFGLGNIYTFSIIDNEKAMQNLCKAYRIYSEEKSPYRTDAEKLISIVYKRMKNEGKEKEFMKLIIKNNLNFISEKP